MFENLPLTACLPKDATMMRTNRLRRTRQSYTPSSKPTRVTSTNYNVNEKKALQQKLEATERDHLKAEYKHGNLVLSFSTAAFEAFRQVVK